MIVHRPHDRERLGLGLLIFFYVVICCVSLVHVARFNYAGAFNPATLHIFYDPARSLDAVAVVAVFAPVSVLFSFVRFSIGYFVGFYFYMMVLSYLWLNCFTDLDYDHHLAAVSAAVSCVAFLLPALFFTSPIRQAYVLPEAAFDRLLTFILLLAVATAAVGAAYSFRLVAIEDMYAFREKIESPAILNYLIGMTCSALLPFAFAGFVARKAYWRAGAVLGLLFLFYPITLTKSALFAPFWLVAMLLLSRLVRARSAVVLSLLMPVTAGLVLLDLLGARAVLFFSIVNARLAAIPSVAIDVYNEFFSRHDLTHFCQISLLKPLMDCPYREQLGIVMQKAYALGNFNGSLFVTEGIASVGVWFAPAAVFVCGLVFALANRLSAGLPPSFILISGALIPQILLNVPLTTALLTHGTALLVLLWYMTPRAIFEPKNGAEPTRQSDLSSPSR
jgi:hypothetical protein